MNSNNPPVLKPFKSPLERLTIEVDTFSTLFKEIIIETSDFSKIDWRTLKFTCLPGFKPESEFNFSRMVEYQVKPFDWVIFQFLKNNGKKVIFTEVERDRIYTASEYSAAIFSVYFMLMVRDKIKLNENEKIPAILAKNYPEDFSYEDVLKLLTSNNIENVNHNWIFNIKASELGEVIKNRLMKGISGMRLPNVLINNQPKKDAPEEVLRLIRSLKKIMNQGIRKEIHPRAQPESIKLIGLNKNFSNMILLAFTDEQINEFVKTKQLYSRPKYDKTHEQFYTWPEDFFDYLKTPLFE